MSSPAEEAHQRLVDQLIAHGSLWSRSLIEAFRSTPRHRFLDHVYDYQKSRGRWHEVATQEPGPAELALIYSDRVLTTRLSDDAGPGSGVAISSSSQPSLMAQMLEDLDLQPGQRVLEVGSGTGYNAALLAYVAGPVYSIDIDPRVLEEARRHLADFADRWVQFHQADGRLGFPPGAPYDRIMVTASTADLAPAWLEQTVDGGLVLAPVALAPGLSYVICAEVVEGVFHGRLTRPAYFMPLRDEDQMGSDEENPDPLRPPDTLKAGPAPWADWTDRKLTGDIAEILHALAFLAWLDGANVNYATLSDNRPGYGIADADRQRVLWMGTRHWYGSGPDAFEAGQRLWHNFLENGGPRPAEFQLLAQPRGQPATPFPPAPSVSLVTYHRPGPSCNQTWWLPPTRQRWG
jgi:protein-L-isoaspartate(D-aspartate) O-methyltransferase